MCTRSGTFPIKPIDNILPLPSIEKLNYDKQRLLSFTDDVMKKKWENFLYHRDDYMKVLMNKRELYKPENLRWKMYLQYVRQETLTIPRSIGAGISLDSRGRVPIPYDLYNFRKDPKTQSSSKLTVKHKAEAKISKPKWK